MGHDFQCIADTCLPCEMPLVMPMRTLKPLKSAAAPSPCIAASRHPAAPTSCRLLHTRCLNSAKTARMLHVRLIAATSLALRRASCRSRSA